MSGDERGAILRIRCTREEFRHFRRVAADYQNYGETLRVILEAYERLIKTYPEFAKVQREPKMGRYQVTTTL